MTTEPEQAVVAAELAEIRRNLDVGVARIDGQLALLAQRSAQHDRDVTKVTERVRVLEHGRWPLPSLAALTGVGALAVAVWQAAGR
ncbi:MULTISPECIES: hypothetical protein [Streptomyces]|uniref:Uncharacterized protein n=1 Tax=Streptomyces buecherae TaxID=2763006 RepID=A0A7H8NFH6_9ACTN|nr:MULTISPECIES: hypothetical protein [Streptomyces]MBC3985485.1 hypothetical protein [Streptomyces buecherae]MBC3988945.1 hypothetical protein [Streptomyces buecherae]QKW53192.1 hypothetical protein HUT08_30745 [Streptomyces buecherae]QNJ39267.1 hypothetical protein H7H31_04635 [Streptomyces buecherae]WEV24536.1 hypothetical protein OYE22_04440 [Streptomyces sp. 71268]